MSHLPVHPAPGLGELLPGWFVVPQNPLRPDSTPVVASITAKAQGATVKIPSMGDLLPGFFVVPQNPLRDALGLPRAMAGLGSLGCGSCGGHGGLGQAPTAPALMGSLANATESISNWMQEYTGPLPNYVIALGIAAIVFLYKPGGKEYQEAKHKGRRFRRWAKAAAE